MAAHLGVPADTVRGWIRRVNGRAEWLRVEGTTAAHAFDPTLNAIEPTAARSPLAEACAVPKRATPVPCQTRASALT